MTNPDNVGGLVWYVCTSCMLMVQLPSDTPTLGRCQCSPKGWSLRRAKLPKGYELCRAAPAGSGEVDLEEFREAVDLLRITSLGGKRDCERHGTFPHDFDRSLAKADRLLALIDSRAALLRKLQQGAE